MTTREENNLLTQTGPGTPAGNFMRRYWHPVALSIELQDAPLPVKILGEDLVLFRDGHGVPGLLGILCPHRCADLSYARLESEGLRCLYHGWLFDREGRCLDQPAEPSSSTYKDEIRHTAYPCKETGGVILAFMGHGEAPALPNFHFLTAPQSNLFQTKVHHSCNYLQANEGNLDPAHLSFLHAIDLDAKDDKDNGSKMLGILSRHIQPDIFVERTRFGVRIHTVRPANEEKKYLRVTNFVMPNMGFFSGSGTSGPGAHSVHWHVPINDHSHWRFDFYYSAGEPIDREMLTKKVQAEVGPGYQPVRTKENRYLQDRSEMKVKTFAGMGVHFPSHDVFAVETPGSIHDRTREHLATTDVAIITARRMMLNAIRELQKGKEAPLFVKDGEANDFCDVVVLAALIPQELDPKDYCANIVNTQDYHALKQ